ncbi:hypothetical protein Golob_007636 [Gossypium lobatum]|uniref:RNase H type-1 domain-containing protein n=1 Tax=Gossypium lobatum TaxID=34289 RepID=A0A7J8MD12_9ROSI|nr:hypothetical protein [Gossypium lobatum]
MARHLEELSKKADRVAGWIRRMRNSRKDQARSCGIKEIILKAPEEDKSSISAPIKEIKARANSFESMEFRFIPRQRNRAVHLLVEEGRRCRAPQF